MLAVFLPTLRHFRFEYNPANAYLTFSGRPELDDPGSCVYAQQAPLHSSIMGDLTQGSDVRSPLHAALESKWPAALSLYVLTSGPGKEGTQAAQAGVLRYVP